MNFLSIYNSEKMILQNYIIYFKFTVPCIAQTICKFNNFSINHEKIPTVITCS